MIKKDAINDPYYLNREGELLEETGFYEEAVRYYSLAIEADSKYPPCTDAADNKVSLLGRMGEWGEAAISSFYTIEISDSYRDAERLNELINAAELDEAQRVAGEMLKENKDNFSAAYLSGYVLTLKEKYEEALGYYIKASEIDPNNVHVWDDIGLCYLELNKPSEALASLDRCLEIDLFRANTWNNKAIALAEVGRKEEAIKCYEKALKVDPEDPIVRQNIEELLGEEGANR